MHAPPRTMHRAHSRTHGSGALTILKAWQCGLAGHVVFRVHSRGRSPERRYAIVSPRACGRLHTSESAGAAAEKCALQVCHACRALPATCLSGHMIARWHAWPFSEAQWLCMHAGPCMFVRYVCGLVRGDAERVMRAWHDGGIARTARVSSLARRCGSDGMWSTQVESVGGSWFGSLGEHTL